MNEATVNDNTYTCTDGTVLECVGAKAVNGRPCYTTGEGEFPTHATRDRLYVHSYYDCVGLSCWVEALPAPKPAGPEQGIPATDVAAMAPSTPKLALPTDDKARKGLPIFRGPLMYFPQALLQVAAVCKAGNDQHNPGEPLHWARGKSMEQMDTALRHMMDHGLGNTKDTDGQYHLAKAAWRILAELQLTIEREAANG